MATQTKSNASKKDAPARDITSFFDRRHGDKVRSLLACNSCPFLTSACLPERAPQEAIYRFPCSFKALTSFLYLCKLLQTGKPSTSFRAAAQGELPDHSSGGLAIESTLPPALNTAH